MNSRNKSIVLVDQLISENSDWLTQLKTESTEVITLDPVNLFSTLDWTCFEDDVRVINVIYSRLFEEVIMNRKKLICFWPLANQLGNEWFELATLCKENSHDLELYKSGIFEDHAYGISDEILSAWKRFVFFMIESLLEDYQLNEQFDEIATLTSEENTIVLFKIEKEGTVRYSFAFGTDYIQLASIPLDEYDRDTKNLESFDSFNHMLEKLLRENDLSVFEPRFTDRKLEKAYFHLLSKEFKTKNLIENWLKTYSMN